MKHASITAIVLMAATLAYAAPAPYPLPVNSRSQTAPPAIAYAGNLNVYRVTLTDGNTASPIVGTEVPFMAWATNNTAAVNSTGVCSVVSGTTGVFDVVFSPASVNFSAGRYIYEVGVKSNGVPRTYRQGAFQIIGSPVGGSVGSVNWTTNIDWSTISWANLPAGIGAAPTDTTARASIAALQARTVDSVNGLTGAVSVATAAQGAKADTALQPADTNGWTTTAHQAWLTSEADATALAALATNQVRRWYASTTNWLEYTGSNVVFSMTVKQEDIPCWKLETSGISVLGTTRLAAGVYRIPDAPFPAISARMYFFDGSNAPLRFEPTDTVFFDDYFWSYFTFSENPTNATLTSEVESAVGSLNLYWDEVGRLVTTNSTPLYLQTNAVPPESWSYADMTNWLANGGAGETYVSEIAGYAAQSVLNGHTGLADPHAGKYVKLTGGAATNLTLDGNVTIGNVTRNTWPSEGAITNGQSGLTLSTNNLAYVPPIAAGSYGGMSITESRLGSGIKLGIYDSGSWTVTGLWPAYVTPTAANSLLTADISGNTYFNAQTGNGMYFSVNNVYFLTITASKTTIDNPLVVNGSVTAANVIFSTPRWIDEKINGMSIVAGSTAPSMEVVSPDTPIKGLGFDSTDDGYFTLQFAHGLASTNAAFPNLYFEPHVHISCPTLTAPNTNVTFGIEFRIAAVNGTFSTVYAATNTIGVTDASKHTLLMFGNFTNNVISGRDSVVVQGRIGRVASAVNDYGAAHVIVDSLDFHIPVDSVGSTGQNGDAQ